MAASAEDILNTPPYGSINVHSSLLPKYRGAAPINWAILNGERETGVTIMYMARELDAGDILHVLKTDIDPQEDAQTLTARLAELGGPGAVRNCGTAACRNRSPHGSGSQRLYLRPHAHQGYGHDRLDEACSAHS